VAEVVERDSGSGHRVSSGGQCFFCIWASSGQAPQRKLWCGGPKFSEKWSGLG
jgi:hypothetical protein